MTPEEKARVKIDQMFEDAGWQVVDRDDYTPTQTAVAIREGLLKGNRRADGQCALLPEGSKDPGGLVLRLPHRHQAYIGNQADDAPPFG